MAFVLSNVINSTLIHRSSIRSSSFLSRQNSSQVSTSQRFLKSCNPVTPTRFTMQVLDVKKHEVFMPALSSTMTEGRLVQWLKQPGDRVEVGDPLMVVESDKADMEVESFEAGFLANILIDEGETCDVGVTVGIIVESKDDIDKIQSTTASSSVSSAAPPPLSQTSPAQSTPSNTSQPPSTKPDLAEVFMPALSSTMTEGKVVEWMKAEGDEVKVGETVMVVESDKADMDVESFESGYMAHISVDAGVTCPVGDPVAYLARSEADIPAVKAWVTAQNASSTSAPVASVATPAPPAVIPKPAVDASVSSPSGTTVVNQGRIIASPRAKVVAKELGVDLRYVAGTGPDGRIQEKDVRRAKEEGAGVGDINSAARSSVAFAVPAGKIIATPDAKKIAKKEKVDLSTVNGTGNFGRITAKDVLRAAGKELVEAPTPSVGGEIKKDVTSTTDVAKKAQEMLAGAVAMNALQKAVVQNMNASLTVPVFRLTYKIKTTALDELYTKVKPKGVTMSALLAKAVAITLSKHPIMNAQFVENSILYRPGINVAVAVAMNDGGLITPTLKDADKTDLYSMSRQWKDLVKRALDKKLSVDEYSSGTFYISNLGMFGVEQFDAVLPPGAPGILAIGASTPVVGLQSSGLIGVEKQMSVTLTADHRHIYGADGARFMQDLADLIENDVTTLLL
eukprot:GFKZ01000176.1.p1 GENE.GFKZ01000176.1~~GFKZ01000176.1.p1  ORF type:complete len:679 (-),score=115.49 GFKZ01000176.1:898-2934(-)